MVSLDLTQNSGDQKSMKTDYLRSTMKSFPPSVSDISRKDAADPETKPVAPSNLAPESENEAFLSPSSLGKTTVNVGEEGTSAISEMEILFHSEKRSCPSNTNAVSDGEFFFQLPNIDNATADEIMFLALVHQLGLTEARMIAAHTSWQIERPLQALLSMISAQRVA